MISSIRDAYCNRGSWLHVLEEKLSEVCTPCLQR